MGDNSTARLDETNEPQPDLLLLIDPDYGGQAEISEEDCVEAAPELVAEVASSSASYDLHAKLEAYRRSGVQEYIVWRVLDRALDWFVLRDQLYEPLSEQDGLLRSTVFPGLWLNAMALLSGDINHVLADVRQGVVSPEHAAFVERLRAAKRR